MHSNQFDVAAPIWLRESGPPRLAARRLSRFYRLAAAGRPNLAHVPCGPGNTAALLSVQTHTTKCGTGCFPLDGCGISPLTPRFRRPSLYRSAHVSCAFVTCPELPGLPAT